MSSGGSKSQTVTTDIPAQYKDFANQALTVAGTVANQPYVQYQGPRIAGWSGQQQQAFDQIANSDFGTGAMRDLTNYQSQTAAQNMDAYRNPYEQDVVNATMTDYNKGLQKGLAALGARGAAGNFGSRQGVAEGVATAEALDALTRNIGNLRYQGFTTAAGLGAGDADRNLSGAGLRLNAANSLSAAEQAKANMLMQAGAMQQGLDQSNLDLAYSDFLEQQNYPIRQLSIMQSALGQTPMGSVSRGPGQGTNVGGLMSGAGSLLSGAAAVAPYLCWVAREVYGIDNPKWLVFRSWLLTKAPAWLRKLYIKHGERFAVWIADKPRIKRVIRAAMDKAIGG
jgi:hypothetical protein